MAKVSVTESQDVNWSSFFQHFGDPIALLQQRPDQELAIIRQNTAFEQLFSAKAEEETNRLTEDLKLQLVPLTQTPDASVPIWCYKTESSPCSHFRLRLNKSTTNSDYFLLVMHDITTEQACLLELSQQNAELKQRLADIERLKNRIKEQAIRDPLTNLFNRRFLNEFMERELAQARRNQKPLSLVMLDLDHFKQLNDQYGHQTGDMVIEMVAKNLLRQSRRTDILFRYGGEEFLVVLPNTTDQQAKHLAENWRLQVQAARVQAKHQTIHVTVSAGIACYPEHGTTAFNLIQAADEALYQAKAAGRNQVVLC